MTSYVAHNSKVHFGAERLLLFTGKYHSIPRRSCAGTAAAITAALIVLHVQEASVSA